MKLTILSQFYPPDYAATGQLLEELGSKLVQKGINVQVFSGQPGYAFDQALAAPQEISKGVFIRRTRTSRIWPQRLRGRAIGGLLYSLRVIVKLRTRDRIGDVLMTTTEPPFLMIFCYCLHLLYQTPYICLIYDIYPDIAIILGVLKPTHWIVGFWQFLNRLTWKKAAMIIVLNESMKKIITEHLPEVSSKIKVIHSWADGITIQPREKTENWFAQKYGLDKVFTVLYSGNLGRCHDLETILGAMQTLKFHQIQFVFIGSGAKLQVCQNYVAKHQLSNCLFLPFQPKETLPFSLTSCDLSLVTIDKLAEGLIAPSKLYGCLAAGKAIAAICPPHSYLTEIIAQAQCGRAIDNGNVAELAQFILGLKNNPIEAALMGKNGREYFERNFTLETIANQYFETIQTAARANS